MTAPGRDTVFATTRGNFSFSPTASPSWSQAHPRLIGRGGGLGLESDAGGKRCCECVCRRVEGPPTTAAACLAGHSGAGSMDGIINRRSLQAAPAADAEVDSRGRRPCVLRDPYAAALSSEAGCETPFVINNLRCYGSLLRRTTKA